MQAPLSTAPSQIPPLRKDHVVISSFPFVLLEVEVEEVALDTHFRVMEVKAWKVTLESIFQGEREVRAEPDLGGGEVEPEAWVFLLLLPSSLSS